MASIIILGVKFQIFCLNPSQASDFSSKLPIFKIGNFEKNEDGSYSCNECEYKTKSPGSLKRHKLGKHQGAKFECDLCKCEYSQKSSLQTHKKSKHEGKNIDANTQ